MKRNSCHWSDFTMNSIDKECNELKQRYDACFNAWFSEQFLKNGKSNLEQCDPIFKEYQKCVKAAIKKNNIPVWELEKEVLGTDKEKQPPLIPGDASQPS